MPGAEAVGPLQPRRAPGPVQGCVQSQPLPLGLADAGTPQARAAGQRWPEPSPAPWPVPADHRQATGVRAPSPGPRASTRNEGQQKGRSAEQRQEPQPVRVAGAPWSRGVAGQAGAAHTLQSHQAPGDPPIKALRLRKVAPRLRAKAQAQVGDWGPSQEESLPDPHTQVETPPRSVVLTL